jgi:hypothetical protein
MTLSSKGVGEMALTWYRMSAQEGETSRVRTSSGSYTIVGIMTSEGKSFELLDSAGFIAARPTQREAKERAEVHAAEQAKSRLSKERAEVAPATARAALDGVREALVVAERALAEVDAPSTTEGFLRGALDAHDADLKATEVLAYRRALTEMGSMLDSWIEGAKSNCEAMGHGGASSHDNGRACGQVFEVEDFRNMIRDVEDILGVVRGAE